MTPPRIGIPAALVRRDPLNPEQRAALEDFKAFTRRLPKSAGEQARHVFEAADHVRAMRAAAVPVVLVTANRGPLSPHVLDTARRHADLYPRLLDSVRADYDAHDKSCLSLSRFWFGHHGGVSSFAELDDCAGCGATFFIEGLAWVNYRACQEDPNLNERYLCQCCATADGHQVTETAHGLTVNESSTDRA